MISSNTPKLHVIVPVKPSWGYCVDCKTYLFGCKNPIDVPFAWLHQPNFDLHSDWWASYTTQG